MERIIGNFKTVFPPLLIELQRHLALVKRVVDAALEGASASKIDKLSSDYWNWYEGEGSVRIKQLNNPHLLSEWTRVGKLHAQFLNAANSCVKASAEGDRIHVSEGLERVLGLSSELVGALVGGSLSELMAAIGAHERELNARHERDFMEAAQIARFSVRLPDNVLIEPDHNFLGFLGFTLQEVENHDIQQFINAKAYQRLLKAASNRESNGRSDISVKHKNGRKVALEVVAYFEENSKEKILRCFAANMSQLESDAQQRRLLSTAIEVSDQVVMITDSNQEIVYINPAFTRLSGYDAKDALGKNPRFLQGKDTSQATRIAIREAMAGGRNVQVEMLNYTKEGLRYWIDLSIVPVKDDSGEITHFVSVQHDITERKAAEQAIARIALEDHLTGLPNRRAAETRLETEWNRARRGAADGFAIGVVDLDRFKLVNDQHGHHVGDQALKHVSDVMASNLRGGDWIARWGGEEFLLCFHDMDNRGVHTAAERVRKLVKSHPLKMPVGELPLTISMGVSMYSHEHENIDAMLAQADSLLYEAKHSGRDKVLCSGRVNTRKGSVIWEGSQVQGALQEGRVLPAFQPIVNLRTGEIVADEALARIRAHDNTLVPATNFIQAAEALHLVASIDKTVSTSAMERCARAIKDDEKIAGRTHFINLSYQFLANPEQVEGLLEQAQSFCASCGDKADIKPLVIEVTERQSGDILTLKKNLQPLTDFGFRLALDDFGSGYSSFLYLAELPVDFLKIEGWMVSRINHDTKVRQLVETLVDTARKFNVVTIAECVEDAGTAQVLCDIGVDWAQGYYFAKPQVDGGNGV